MGTAKHVRRTSRRTTACWPRLAHTLALRRLPIARRWHRAPVLARCGISTLQPSESLFHWSLHGGLFFQDRLPSSLPVNVDDTQILRARPLDLPSPEMTAEEIVARCPAIPLDDRTLPPGCKWLGNSIVGGPAGLNPSVAVAAPIDPVILHTSYRSETRTVADTSVTVPRPGLAQAGES